MQLKVLLVQGYQPFCYKDYEEIDFLEFQFHLFRQWEKQGSPSVSTRMTTDSRYGTLHSAVETIYKFPN